MASDAAPNGFDSGSDSADGGVTLTALDPLEIVTGCVTVERPGPVSSKV